MKAEIMNPAAKMGSLAVARMDGLLWLPRIIVATILAATWMSGCSDLGVEPDPLYATADGQYVRLVNTSNETLYYFMAPTQALPWIDWIAPPNPNVQNKVASKNSVRIRYQDLWWVETMGNYKDVTVYWWRLIPKGDGTYAVDKIHSCSARL
jgi:hypothetical protein